MFFWLIVIDECLYLKVVFFSCIFWILNKGGSFIFGCFFVILFCCSVWCIDVGWGFCGWLLWLVFFDSWLCFMFGCVGYRWGWGCVIGCFGCFRFFFCSGWNVSVFCCFCLVVGCSIVFWCLCEMVGWFVGCCWVMLGFVIRVVCWVGMLVDCWWVLGCVGVDVLGWLIGCVGIVGMVWWFVGWCWCGWVGWGWVGCVGCGC